MSISAGVVKNLRDKTGISMMVCKKALEEAGGDETKAMGILKEKGLEVAEKKSSRGTKAGTIESYIHGTGQIGVLVELKSETDFVAKNPLFKEVAHDIAMHIAASDPENVEMLLEQPFVKKMDITISNYLNEIIQKFGENIEIARFERFSL
ncbi:MAG: translation elongation factor Ts [Patescibacteria group bacterium]